MNIDVILKKINIIHKNKNDFYNFLLSRTRKRKLKKDYIFDELIKFIKEYNEIKCEIFNKYKILNKQSKRAFLYEVRTIISYKRLMNLCIDKESIPTIKKFNKYILLLKIINKYIDNQVDCNNRFITKASIEIGYPHNWLILLRERHPITFKEYFCKCNTIKCYVENYNKMVSDYYFFKDNLINKYRSFDRAKRKEINKRFKEFYNKYDVNRLYRTKNISWFSLMILDKFLILNKIIEDRENEKYN